MPLINPKNMIDPIYANTNWRSVVFNVYIKRVGKETQKYINNI